jgi:hypothetical protein
MNETKKKKKTESIKEDESSMQVMETLGEVLYENTHNTDQDNLEVFDKYAHVLMLKIFAKEEKFCDRLTKGYETLINELATLKTTRR